MLTREELTCSVKTSYVTEDRVSKVCKIILNRALDHDYIGTNYAQFFCAILSSPANQFINSAKIY